MPGVVRDYYSSTLKGKQYTGKQEHHAKKLQN